MTCWRRVGRKSRCQGWRRRRGESGIQIPAPLNWITRSAAVRNMNTAMICGLVNPFITNNNVTTGRARGPDSGGGACSPAWEIHLQYRQDFFSCLITPRRLKLNNKIYGTGGRGWARSRKTLVTSLNRHFLRYRTTPFLSATLFHLLAEIHFPWPERNSRRFRDSVKKHTAEAHHVWRSLYLGKNFDDFNFVRVKLLAFKGFRQFCAWEECDIKSDCRAK